jgi:hypothetical protein
MAKQKQNKNKKQKSSLAKKNIVYVDQTVTQTEFLSISFFLPKS